MEAHHGNWNQDGDGRNVLIHDQQQIQQQQHHQHQQEPHIAVHIEGGPVLVHPVMSNGPIRDYRTIRRNPGAANPHVRYRREPQYCCNIPFTKIIFITAMLMSSFLLLVMFAFILADAINMYEKYHPRAGNEPKYF